MKRFILHFIALISLLSYAAAAQDWIKTGTNLGQQKIRLAAADFQASTQDAKNAELLKVFNDTLWNDLDNAGIFDMVSKSFNPTGAVGSPSDVKFDQWGAPPPNAALLKVFNDTLWNDLDNAGIFDIVQIVPQGVIEHLE